MSQDNLNDKNSNNSFENDDSYFDLESLLAQYKPADKKTSSALKEEDLMATLGEDEKKTEYEAFMQEASDMSSIENDDYSDAKNNLQETTNYDFLFDKISDKPVEEDAVEEPDEIEEAEENSEEVEEVNETEDFILPEEVDDFAAPVEEPIEEEKEEKIEDDDESIVFIENDDAMPEEEVVEDEATLESTDTEDDYTVVEDDIHEEDISKFITEEEKEPQEEFSKESAESEMENFVQDLLENELNEREESPEDYVQQSIDEYAMEENGEETEDKLAVEEVEPEEDLSETKFYNPSSQSNKPNKVTELDESDTDTGLLAALGFESKEEEQAGIEHAFARDVKKRRAPKEKPDTKTYDFEYTDPSQTKSVVAAYKQTKQNLTIKLVITTIFAILLLAYEHLPMLGVIIADALNPARYPVVFIMVGLQLVLFAAVPAYEQIIYGFKKLVTGKPTLESIPTVMILADVLYSVIVCLAYKVGDTPKLVGFPIAIAMIILLLFAKISINREMYSFDVISTSKTKYVASDATLNSQDGIGEVTTDSKILTIDKTTFVDGYFARTYEESENVKSYVLKALLATLAIALLVSIYAVIAFKSIVAMAFAFMAVIVTASPISLLIAYSYPLLFANRNAYNDESAIIGESTIDKYSETSIINVNDVVAIPSNCVKLQNIIIYNKNRIENVLYYASSMFTFTGGPLADVFESTTNEIGRSDNVKIVESSMGFLKAEIDGRKVLFCKKSELKNHGFDISSAVVKDDDVAPDVSIMFMFIDYKLAAKMYIKYSISPEFEGVIKELDAHDVRVTLRTFDPNINDDLFAARTEIPEGSLTVKSTTLQESRVGLDSAINGGMVSHNKPLAILKLFNVCDAILNIRKTGFIIGMVSLILGAVLVLLGLSLNVFTKIPSILLAVYQLVWVVPALLVSRLKIK